MTRQELAQVLAERGVPPAAYSLAGGLPNEAYCLDHAGGRWAVYYSERGQPTDLVEFATETAACDHFLRVLDAPRPTTEAEWLTAADPVNMLGLLRGRGATDRKLRLLGCACVRRVWLAVPDSPTRRCVEAVERFADGRERAAVIGTLRKQAARAADTRFVHASDLTARRASVATTTSVLAGAARLAGWEDGWGVRTDRVDREVASQAALVRDIFGNPFRPVTADPAWLTPTVVGLAAAIYEDRAFDRLPVLADALEEAGCDSDEMLTHSRRDGVHVRGCWVEDLLLGKV